MPGIETCGELPWHELMACLTQSRVAFFPNVLDASPVFLTEALCLDVPIVVNRRIIGGWKYVRPGTGRFFTNENDVTGAVAECLGEQFAPRAWFRAVHGPDNAASWRRSSTRWRPAHHGRQRGRAAVTGGRSGLGRGSGAGGTARPALRARGEPAPPAQV